MHFVNAPKKELVFIPRFHGVRKLVLACLCALLLLSQPIASAQNSERSIPAFDVVSVRQIETTQVERGPNSVAYITTAHKACDYSLGRVTCQLSLKELIAEAFKLKQYEIAAPGWLADNLFVFQATMLPNTGKEDVRVMLQQALEDRFGLRFHFAQRTVSGYAMIPAKGGARLQPADDAEHRQSLTLGGRGGASLTMSPGQFSAVAIPLDLLAANLQTFAGLDRPVVNMTGLDGVYKIDLHWRETEDNESIERGMDPGFREAVRAQLGLDLERRQIQARVLVVDHANRGPTEN